MSLTLLRFVFLPVLVLFLVYLFIGLAKMDFDPCMDDYELDCPDNKYPPVSLCVPVTVLVDVDDDVRC